MKKLLVALTMSFAATGYAAVPVNIIYPIHGGSYPVVSPGAHAEYVTFSFSATCGGGPHKVSWGADAATFGSASFYDQYTTQQVNKLASGGHVFWVETDCGEDRVWFKVK